MWCDSSPRDCPHNQNLLPTARVPTPPPLPVGFQKARFPSRSAARDSPHALPRPRATRSPAASVAEEPSLVLVEHLESSREASAQLPAASPEYSPRKAQASQSSPCR